MQNQHRVVDEQWLIDTIATSAMSSPDTPQTARLRTLLEACAGQFAIRRTDVVTGRVVWPRRGLLHDEAASFLRAVDQGLATVNEAGYVTLPTVRPKVPEGRYALLSKSGDGVSVNLEYLIQIGATAELVLDTGWPPHLIDFERGEFDALASSHNGRVVLAMEAKARVTGADSLDSLVRFWLLATRDAKVDLNTNAGRKYRELVRRCAHGPVHVWLVADGARWSLSAVRGEAGVVLSSGTAPSRSTLISTQPLEATMHESFPYGAAYHRPGSVAAQGRCSQHGVDSCFEAPVISFQDRHDRWQSGCQRALDELVARGEISPPRSYRGP